jgi:hypothetical protein
MAQSDMPMSLPVTSAVRQWLGSPQPGPGRVGSADLEPDQGGSDKVSGM